MVGLHLLTEAFAYTVAKSHIRTYCTMVFMTGAISQTQQMYLFFLLQLPNNSGLYLFFFTHRPLVQAGVCAFLEVLTSAPLDPAVSTIVFPVLWRCAVSEVGMLNAVDLVSPMQLSNPTNLIIQLII